MPGLGCYGIEYTVLGLDADDPPPARRHGYRPPQRLAWGLPGTCGARSHARRSLGPGSLGAGAVDPNPP